MAITKAIDAVRRNELLVLTSLLAGLLMAVVQMGLDWAATGSLWAFPGTIAAVAFRSLQTSAAGGFTPIQLATGFGIHIGLSLALGVLFARLAPKLDDVMPVARRTTLSDAILGGAFGLGVFAVAWWGVLPYANPIMIAALEPSVFGAMHVIWGFTIGAFRTAWEASLRPARSTASAAAPAGSPTPSPAEPDRSEPTFPSHDPAEGSQERQGLEAPAGPAAQHGGHEGIDLKTSSVGRGEPGLDPSLRNGNHVNGAEDHEEPETEEDTSSSAGSADYDRAFGSGSDNEDVELATSHAERSLEGLTGHDAEYAPVQEKLDATLTHVAPGRAVCAVDADEDVHNINGTIQAGFLMSLAEVAADVALRTEFPDTEHGIVGVTSEVHKTAEGGHIVAEAVVTEAAGTARLVEAEVRNEQGEVLIEIAFNAVGEDETEPADS